MFVANAQVWVAERFIMHMTLWGVALEVQKYVDLRRAQKHDNPTLESSRVDHTTLGTQVSILSALIDIKLPSIWDIQERKVSQMEFNTCFRFRDETIQHKQLLPSTTI